MTYETHRQFAVFWALLAAIILYVTGMTEINYYLALCIIVPFAKLGAEFPDYDHIWQNIKNKTVISWIVNKIIHLTGGHHRSWQTHSIDLVIASTVLSYFLPRWLHDIGVISKVNREVLNVVLFGFSVGWFSHIFADMLSGKVKLFCFSNKWVGLVPRKFLGFKFNTGSDWEQFVYNVTKLLNLGITTMAILFPFFYRGYDSTLVHYYSNISFK